MKIHQRVLLVVWLLIIALLPVRAATYKGTITLRVGETTRVNIGSGYMGTEIITSGYWDKSNSTFVIESVSGMYHKECTIRGNTVGTGKLYWDGYIFGDSWSFYWDVNVIQNGGSQPGSSDIWYENDYGKWGDITIKYGDTKTLSHKFPSSVMNSRVNWEWCLRDGNNAEHLQEDVAVKITSQSVSSCTIKGVGPQLYDPSRLYYYVQTGTYNGSKVYAVGYYNIYVDYAGKVTTSSNRPSGTYEEGTKIYLTPSVSGGEIFYTTDGSEPTYNSTFYTNEGITLSKSMTLKARSYAYGYSSDVVNSWTYTVAETGIEINATNFPDASFRSWLLSQSYGADGKLTESEISKITSITVQGSSSTPGTIKSLKGIEYFTALTYLSCSNNLLTSLDVSKLTALETLHCHGNQLTALDVSKNVALKFLFCSNNQLTTLDVSNLTALTTLHCDDNQLTSLDVSKLTALKVLYCWNNKLTALDVSKLTALTYLSCENNQLTTLNVSKLTALTSLYCYNNQLTSLDVSRLTALTSLSCYNNQLTSLDVSKNTALTFLSCYNNSIKGAAMDNLISSLPKNNTSEVHRFRVVGEDLSNEGNVCTTTHVAAVKAKGWFPCYYDSTTKEYVEYEGGDGQTNPKGDVNGDGQVNGTDLVALTNIILGKSSKTDAADVNGDGYVNGTDYVALANIVLGRSNAKATAMAKGAIQAAATTGLSIEPFDIKAGETKEMVIDLTNASDDITLVQFDLRLPKGLSLKQSGGEYDYDIAGRTTWRKHSLDANATNGIVRFLLASSSNATLTGTEGSVIKITIQADNNFTGGDIQLENILMVTPAEKEIKQDTYTYQVGQSQPSPASTGLAVEPFSISAGGEAEMVIDLNNPDDEITLVQFDLRLPNGLSVKQSGGEYDFDIAGRTTWRKHSLDANATNGIVRFLLASSSNATLTGTEGAVIKITLKADNSFAGGAVKLENILLVTPAEKEIKQSDVNYTIGTTGIKSVVIDNIEKNTPIYNLSGQRLDKPRKGINIIGGKKVMVK